MQKSYVHSFFKFIFVLSFYSCTQHSTINFGARGISSGDQQPIVSPLACDPALTTSYGGGTGIISDPYTICSLAQWNFLGTDSTSWGKYFKLYSDIDFTSTTYATFYPIGTTGTPFTGQIDGNGFKLMNLSITTAGAGQSLAFFTKTNGSAVIKNLTLKNITMNASERVSGLILDHGTSGPLTLDHLVLDTLNLNLTVGGVDSIGGLVGSASAPVVVSNVTFHSILFADPPGSTRYVGGFIGKSTALVTLSNITGDTVSFATGYSISQSGGLLGNMQANGVFSDINLTAINTRGSQIGGLASQLSPTSSTTSFTRVHIAGSISGVNSAAGLVAVLNGATSSSVTITESSFAGDIVSSSAGGLIDIDYDSDITISKSFFKGNMASIWNGTGSGLIRNIQGATNTLTINDCYAISNLTNVHATNYLIAGLVGAVSSNVVIARSYYSGTLSGTAPAACIGRTSAATSYLATDVYYNSTLCTAGADISGGAITGSTGLTTAALQTATPFTNWSPSVWTFASGQNPKLSWEP